MYRLGIPCWGKVFEMHRETGRVRKKIQVRERKRKRTEVKIEEAKEDRKKTVYE